MWNHHLLSLSEKQNRSPQDMFFFDTIASRDRGDSLLEGLMMEELEQPIHVEDGVKAEFFEVD